MAGMGRYVKFYIATPMHSSQLCLVAAGGMAFDQQLRGEAAHSGVSSYT